MDRLKVGVIGIGDMGANHARVFSEMPDVELYALADLNSVRLHDLAGKYGVEKAYEDYKKVINLEEIDIIDICLPDELHYRPVVESLEAGKHIFLEKPMAAELKEAEDMVSMSKEYQTKFMIGYLLRFDPRYVQIKNAIDNGDLGDIIYIVTHRNSPHNQGPRKYRSGTSLTMHVGVHDLDLIHWYLNSEVESVSAKAVCKMLSHKNMKDAASALIRFENSAMASVNYGWVLPEKYPILLDARLEIVGTKGAAYVGFQHHDGVVMVKEDAVQNPVLLSPEINGKLKGALYEELRAFVDCVKYDQPVPIPPEEGIKSIKTARQIIDRLD